MSDERMDFPGKGLSDLSSNETANLYHAVASIIERVKDACKGTENNVFIAHFVYENNLHRLELQGLFSNWLRIDYVHGTDQDYALDIPEAGGRSVFLRSVNYPEDGEASTVNLYYIAAD